MTNNRNKQKDYSYYGWNHSIFESRNDKKASCIIFFDKSILRTNFLFLNKRDLMIDNTKLENYQSYTIVAPFNSRYNDLYIHYL